ncbi:hypothetical protein QIU18_06625 [Capnocytophaga canimorsus]|nr:hypothetical protein [Capnocytophaga canimorsus]WGU71455.1 hypothetical protein QIU18_06625 [Capnocytophaga canimorsus]
MTNKENLKTEEIRLKLEKYFEGTSSLEEEKELKAYFTSASSFLRIGTVSSAFCLYGTSLTRTDCYAEFKAPKTDPFPLAYFTCGGNL